MTNRVSADGKTTAMRILFASERPPYPLFLGGAARTAHRLLHALTHELGDQCCAVGSSDYAVTPWSYPKPSEYTALGVRQLSLQERIGFIDCGYPINVVPDFMHALSRLIETFKPDVVWAQLEGARPILELSRSKGTQGLLYVHDAEFVPAELRAIADLGSHVVCGSAFLAKKVSKLIGRSAHVVYPCPETDFGTDGDPSGYVTMINPHRVKGIEVFIAIARRLPLERFLLVESWKLTDQAMASLQESLTEAPNVRFLRRVSDMREIYSQTKLLLVPSVWEEGFGMVAIEAQSCRIPVIASARGGLPESVGDGGLLIDDYRNADAWVEAIGSVLKDVDVYRTFAGRAFRHATSDKFSASGSARRLHDICSEPVHERSVVYRGARALASRLQAIPRLGRLFRRVPR